MKKSAIIKKNHPRGFSRKCQNRKPHIDFRKKSMWGFNTCRKHVLKLQSHLIKFHWMKKPSKRNLYIHARDRNIYFQIKNTWERREEKRKEREREFFFSLKKRNVKRTAFRRENRTDQSGRKRRRREREEEEEREAVFVEKEDLTHFD